MAKPYRTEENGVEIIQVTNDPEHQISNIYCERPFTSADSKRFLYARQVGKGEPGLFDNWDYVLCSFSDWTEEVVGRGRLEVAISYQNDYYYLRTNPQGQEEFVRIDLNSGQSKVVYIFTEPVGRAGHPAICPNSRYLIYNRTVGFDPQLFAVEMIDLENGERSTLIEDPYLCNTHLQFCPIDSNLILVQNNKGCKFAPDGTRITLTTGADFFLLDRQGKRTNLPIGKPYTPSITGHQAWLGKSREIITTLNPQGPFAAAPEGQGNIYVINPEGKSRHLPTGMAMNHIGTTPCGTYFHADSIKWDEIIIGNPQTGSCREVCHHKEDDWASTFGQRSHPHAVLTPDFHHVIFNSDRSGSPELYVASLPEGFLDDLNCLH